MFVPTFANYNPRQALLRKFYLSWRFLIVHSKDHSFSQNCWSNDFLWIGKIARSLGREGFWERYESELCLWHQWIGSDVLLTLLTPWMPPLKGCRAGLKRWNQNIKYALILCSAEILSLLFFSSRCLRGKGTANPRPTRSFCTTFGTIGMPCRVGG